MPWGRCKIINNYYLLCWRDGSVLGVLAALSGTQFQGPAPTPTLCGSQLPETTIPGDSCSLYGLWTSACIHTCPHTHTGEDRHIWTQIYTSTIKKNHHWWTTHCPFLIIREQIRIAHRLTKKGDQVKIHICRLPRYFRSASSSKNPLKSRDKRCCTLVLCSCSVSVLREERTDRKWRLGGGWVAPPGSWQSCSGLSGPL